MSFSWVLRPSFAPVWGHCAGAVKAAAPYPNNDTPESLEGSAAHWVVSEVLVACRSVPLTSPPDVLQQVSNCGRFLDVAAPNGVVIDDKMVQGAQVMVDTVLDIAGEYYPHLLVEHVVVMPRIHPQNGGTLDVSLFIPPTRTLYVIDYKHGHVEVEARENFQFIDYSEGMREQLLAGGIPDTDVTLTVKVVQPFAYRDPANPNEWTIPLTEIRGYVNTLEAQANEALSDNPSMTAGKHCYGCPAVGDCGVARQFGYHLVELSKQPYQMDTMAMRDMAVERGIIKDGMQVLKARLKAIDDSLAHRIKAGETGSGLTLEGTTGSQAWTVKKDVAAAMAAQFGFNINKTGIMTPTQAKDACPREHKQSFATVLKSCTNRPAKGLTLVDAENSQTARAFAKQ